MNQCIFCKIAKREILSDVVYEDKDILGFLDINPVNKGHTLVIPKKHVETFLDLDSETLKKFMLATQKIARAVERGMKADGFNLKNSNRKPAGQEIDHVHFHIIPRFRTDGLKHWPSQKYQETEAKEIAKKIQSFL